ncbi:glutaredoxin domain-containing protein [Desulfotruncus arcticus]|uniref:glutaredoxin domain-containing protein n=1 Tax=Desulfotruncus arcticus TaxID=341036 RepID=UPI000B839FF3|nr:glutaredoxin domain-containing protein [Desulfotruncus arcticus]
MKEFLSKKGVLFQELNVAADEKARNDMVSHTGQMAVPTVAVGNQYIVGFDREKLEKVLH